MRRTIHVVASVFCVAFGLVTSLIGARAQSQQGTPVLDEFAEVLQPQIGASVKFDISPPLREMRPIPPPTGPLRVMPSHLWSAPPTPPPQEGVSDPVGQTFQGPLLAGTLGLNFEGQSTDGVVPPDANGAVGATQYVQWVNTTFAVYSKTNGSLLYGPAAGNTLWQGFGGQCETNNSGDAVAKYDQIANRWVMTQPVFTSPYYACFAVSTTSDATGSYYRYAFPMTYFPDYPKLGIWVPTSAQGAAYFWTANSFSGSSLVGAKLCAFDRGAMISGASSARSVCYQLGNYGGCLECGSLLPADQDGSATPSAYEAERLFNLGADGKIGYWTWAVNFGVNPPTSTFQQISSLVPASFYETCSSSSTRTCVAQPNTSQTLQAMSWRLMNRAAYRQLGTYESIVMTHSVQGTSGQQNNYSGIRWYELRAYPPNDFFIFQQGTFKPDTNYRFMGSIAQDKVGDIAVGYSLSSNVNYPSIFITGRVPTDSLGTMEQEVNVKWGTGSQLSSSRWGDYDSMTIDPVDDCTFWYTNEYLPTSGISWHTRIATAKFSGCH